MAFGSVVTEELVAMLAAPFAEVVVASMCFDGKGDDFFRRKARGGFAPGRRVLALDVPQVQFDTGPVVRLMNTPRIDEARLHRVVRCIAGALGVDWLFRWQGGGDFGLTDAVTTQPTTRAGSWATNLRCHSLWRRRVSRFDPMCSEAHLHEELG